MKAFEWDPSYLREVLGDEDDQGFIEKYLATFEMRVKSAFEELYSAIEKSNWEDARSAAHKLKGAAAGVGENTAKQLAGKLQDNPKNHETIVSDLRSAFDLLSDSVKKEFVRTASRGT